MRFVSHKQLKILSLDCEKTVKVSTLSIIHTHILPGIDDGASSMEEAVDMVRRPWLPGKGPRAWWAPMPLTGFIIVGKKISLQGVMN